MGDFFNSKFIKDLQDGNLPVVKIELETKTIINLMAGLLIVAIIILLVVYLVKIGK